MLRCYVLTCSAVALRLISSTVGLIGVSYPEEAYIAAAWCSWLVPLAALEIVERWPVSKTPMQAKAAKACEHVSNRHRFFN